jgi:hypothetical protein
MRRHAQLWAVMLALSACGGAPEMDKAPPALDERAATRSVLPSDAAVSGLARSPPVAASAAVPAPTLQADYELLLFKQRSNWTVQHRDSDALAPVRGTGYPTLYAFIHLREKHRRSPVAGVQAFCATPTRCEYLPPRKAEFPEKFTISLSDSSFIRLSAADDLVAISARELDAAQPVTVLVTLTIPGQPPITRKISYAMLAH